MRMILALLLLTISSVAVSDPDCRPQADRLYRQLYSTWQLASRERPSQAKDAIYSAADYGKAYNEIMKRTPYRQDWTKGVFLAIKDKVWYAYRYASRQVWENHMVWNGVVDSQRRLEELSWCYP